MTQSEQVAGPAGHSGGRIGQGSRIGQVRAHNRVLVLSALRREEALSRVELARTVGLTLPTISRLIDDLVTEKLVEKTGSNRATGGRKAPLYRLRDHGAAVLGVDLSRRGRRIVATDLRATVVASADIATGGRPDEDLRLLAEAAAPILQQIRDDQRPLLGIGIGVPGPLDAEHGIVTQPPNLPGWSHVPLRQQLSALLGIPVLVENNVNAAAYGEYFLHHYTNQNIVYVLASAGIGAGIVIDGRLYRGRTDTVGEIGHCTIDVDGPRCVCGRHGCLETAASTGAMVTAARDAGLLTEPAHRPPSGQEGSEFEALLAAEARQDPTAVRTLATGGRALGIGVANLLNVLDPELVIMGGEAIASDTYFEHAVTEMRERTFVRNPDEIQVERSRVTSDPVAHGAATLALQELVLTSPFA